MQPNPKEIAKIYKSTCYSRPPIYITTLPDIALLFPDYYMSLPIYPFPSSVASVSYLPTYLPTYPIFFPSSTSKTRMACTSSRSSSALNS